METFGQTLHLCQSGSCEACCLCRNIQTIMLCASNPAAQGLGLSWSGAIVAHRLGPDRRRAAEFIAGRRAVRVEALKVDAALGWRTLRHIPPVELAAQVACMEQQESTAPAKAPQGPPNAEQRGKQPPAALAVRVGSTARGNGRNGGARQARARGEVGARSTQRTVGAT